MNIFKKIFSKREKSGEFGISLRSIIGDVGFSDIRETYSSYAYACINARAENVAKAKMFIYSKGKEVFNHDFLKVTKNTNIRKQTFKRILYRTIVHLDLFGNAYWYVVRGLNGKPIAFYILNPKLVNIKLDNTNSYIESYAYSPQSGTVIYPADDIIHFYIPSDDNEFLGKSTVSAVKQFLDTEFLQSKFQKDFYKSGAIMDLIIESEKKINDPECERLKHDIDTGYRGTKNAGKTLVLEDGLKAKSFQQSMKDVELVPARKQIREEILAIFRVPPTILGIADGVNKANAVMALKTFNDYVIVPMLTNYIEDPLNIFLRKNYSEDDSIIFENEFVDFDTKIKMYDLFLKYKVLTPQQIAEAEGYNYLTNKK